MITQDNLSLWKQRIEEQKSSGLGIREWCESKQLSKDAYYYWRNKIRRLSFTSIYGSSFWTGIQRYESADERTDETDIGTETCPWWSSGASLDDG